MNIIFKTWQKSLFTLITGLSLLINTNSVQSQIIPDNTLGNENSKFTPGQVKDLIEGGAIRGNNLFHSFSQFNINNNQQVYFTNPSGINNILTRVTGNNISNIFGTLGVDGNANLFLINPNGIIFGQNAKLDVKGSFFASTANAIKFADNTIFSAKDTSTTPLLTMSVPVGVQWGNNPTGDITNNGNLTVGKDLTLSGKNINSNGILSTPDGKIELTAITGDVQVQQLNAMAAKLTANGNINYGNISMGNENPAITNLNPTLSLIAEKQITGTGNITTTTPGLLVNLQAKDNINIKDISSKGGEINITSDKGDIITGILDTTYKTPPQTTTIDIDKGGTLTISPDEKIYAGEFTFTSNLTDPITEVKVRLSASNILSNSTVDLSSPTRKSVNLINSRGNNPANFQDTLLTDSASLPISSGSTPFNGTFQPSRPLAQLNQINPNGTWNLSISNYDDNNPARTKTTVYKAGDTAPWGITTGTRLIITTSGSLGAGGNVNLKAGGKISTGDINSSSGVNAGLITLNANQDITTGHINSSSMSGNGGAIALITTGGNITTKSLYSSSDSALGNAGNGGDVAEIAENNITSGGINSEGGNGGSGNITLTSNKGEIALNNAYITSSNYGQNKGSDINITARSVFLTNNSQLNASTFGQGNAGTVKITASDTIKFNGESAAGSAVEKGATGKAGGVEISTKSLELLGGSYLNTSTYGQGDAGTVNITATDTVKFDGKSNVASQVEKGAIGKAGGVEISTKSLELLGGSFLDASTFGQGDAGTVKITATDTIKFDGESGVASVVTKGAIGNAGGVEITTKSLELLGGSDLNANTEGQGNAGTVKITATDSIKFDGESFARSRVSPDAIGNAGGVEISTKSLELLGGSDLNANTEGQGNAGTVRITASDTIKFDGKSAAGSIVDTGAIGKAGGVEISTKSLELLGGSQLNASTYGQGDAGGVNISTKSLELLGGSFLNASTYGQGNAGTVKITATDTVKFDGKSSAASQVNEGGVGTAGGVEIATKSLELLGGSFLNASTKGQGNAGTVKITATDTVKFNGKSNVASQVEKGAIGKAGGVEISTKSLELLGISYLDASTFGLGNAGTVRITATDTVKFDGKSSAASQVNERGVGTAGGVEISTKSLELLGGSFLDASTFGQGDAGAVKITATDSIKFDGESYAGSVVIKEAVGKAGGVEISTKSLELFNGSNLDASTEGQGDAGSINITANKLNLNSGSQLLTTTSGNNAAGDINIKVKDSINLNGKNTGFFANTAKNSTGNGGNIKIDPITINIANGAKIAVNSEGTGIGGNIFLQADNLNLNNGNINAETVNSNGGGITLQIGNYLLLQNQSKITSTAGTSQSGGNGGNIKVNAPLIVGISSNPKHQIIANAFSGKGGNILINTQGIFGTEYINIQASSQSGPQGIVEINTPGINPANGLTQLPSIPIDLSALINNSCQVAKRNSFTVAGKGGLTPTPDQTLLVNSILPDWGNSSNISQKSPLISENTLQKEKTNQQEEIREAQGFIKDEKGNIILTSQPLQVTVNGVYLHPLDCERLLK